MDEVVALISVLIMEDDEFKVSSNANFSDIVEKIVILFNYLFLIINYYTHWGEVEFHVFI